VRFKRFYITGVRGAGATGAITPLTPISRTTQIYPKKTELKVPQGKALTGFTLGDLGGECNVQLNTPKLYSPFVKKPLIAENNWTRTVERFDWFCADTPCISPLNPPMLGDFDGFMASFMGFMVIFVDFGGGCWLWLLKFGVELVRDWL
jgi:hypothetical protein